MIPRVTWYGSKGSTVALKKREKGIGRGKKKKFTERGLQFPAETYTEYFKRRGGGCFSRAVDTSNSNAASKLCSKKISKQIMLFANRFIISENSSLFSFLPFPNHSSYFFSFSLTILFALKSLEITLNPPPFSVFFCLSSLLSFFFFRRRKFQIQARWVSHLRYPNARHSSALTYSLLVSEPRVCLSDTYYFEVGE